MTNEEIVRRYAEAVSRGDFATAEAFRHPDWVSDWPQSGERVTSSAAMRAITENYPGGVWESHERRLTGSEDEFVVTPSGTMLRVAGAGETWTAEWYTRYPDGSQYFVIVIVQLRDGRIHRETTYFAAPFEAPEWRRQWVELTGPD